MVVRRQDGEFQKGYNAITEIGGRHSEMGMDVGIVRLDAGEEYLDESGRECALLLMSGEVTLSWKVEEEWHEERATRVSLLDEEPIVLHVDGVTIARVRCVAGEAELAVQRVVNTTPFPPRVWRPGSYRSERFGEGTLQDTSTRTVRTVFDAATAPKSGMVLGEVINHPGKWSSYPPHDHPQPEVYHYRFFPSHGYGHAEREDDVYKVRDKDTYMITPGVTHSQCAAPGYAMYYIWMIPHLPGDKFGPDSRQFRDEHAWVMDSDAPIWPDAPVAEVVAHHQKER